MNQNQKGTPPESSGTGTASNESQSFQRRNDSMSRQAIARKTPSRELVKGSRFIAAYGIPLLEQVRANIVRDWRRGISISYLAKDYSVTVRQAEAVIWESQRHVPPPSTPVTPTVRQSRQPHVVAMRRAA